MHYITQFEKDYMPKFNTIVEELDYLREINKELTLHLQVAINCMKIGFCGTDIFINKSKEIINKSERGYK